MLKRFVQSAVNLSIQRYFASNIPAGKPFDIVVTSLRIDRILATGLGVGRRKVEYSLLSGCVKLNGQSTAKKNTLVKEGDILDVLADEQVSTEELIFSRLKLVEIGETTKKGNIKVLFHRNKVLKVAKSEYLNSLDL